MKRALRSAAILTVLSIFLTTSALASVESPLAISVDRSEIMPGGTVTAAISAQSGLSGIAVWEARVYYDPAVFSYASCRLDGAIYCDPTPQTDANGTYITLSVIDKTASAALAAGRLGGITFTASADAEGASARFGAVQTAGFDAQGRSYDGTRSPAVPAQSAAVAVKTPVPVEPSGIPGDVNGDKSVDENDAALLLRRIVGWVSDASIDREAADMDGDGFITAADAAILLRTIGADAAALRTDGAEPEEGPTVEQPDEDETSAEPEETSGETPGTPEEPSEAEEAASAEISDEPEQ